MDINNEKTKCKNCGSEIKTEGYIYWSFVPVIAVAYGVVARKGFCSDCATKMNGLGFITALGLFVAAVFFAINYLGNS